MPENERHPRRSSFDTEPVHPAPLPKELAAFLRETDYACLMEPTDKGTAFVLKAPTSDIQSVQGIVPIGVRYELYVHPAAPVIRTVITIVDQPDRPLAFETFTNIDDSQQRSTFASLSEQEQLYLLFYDEKIAHRLTKVVPHNDPPIISQIVGEADRLFGAMDIYDYDFDTAKAAVIATTRM